MIKDKAPVTLYVVTHNYTRFLRDALESVGAQTWRPNQLIIIDNGSTDGVEEVLRDYTGREDVTIIRNSNIGHVKAANQALKLSTEKYFMRLDGDDILMPWALEYLVKSMEASPEAAYAFGDYITMDEKGMPLDYCSGVTHSPISKVHNNEFVKPELQFEKYTLNQLPDDFAPHGAVTLIRAKRLLFKGGYDDRIKNGDGRFLRTLFSSSLVLFMKSFLFLYRRHSSSLTVFHGTSFV